jgi:hypothetical protein
MASPVRQTQGVVLQWAFVITATFLAIGLMLAFVLIASGAARPIVGRNNIFFVLFARNEPTHLAIMLLGIVLTYLLMMLRWVTNSESTRSFRKHRLVSALELRFTPVVAMIIFAITAWGAKFVLHDHPLSMDEFMADFQARIFVAGSISGAVPEPWIPFARALAPLFAIYLPETQSWVSGYLPVYSGLRALFMTVGLGHVLNAVLGSASVVLIGLIARRLWPSEGSARIVAIILFISSAQFLIMSMSSYSMPAHLFFNLAWLYLMLLDTRWSMAAAPWVGCLALGLHQVHVHALFAAPFLLQLLISRRWLMAWYFGAVYVVGIATWVWWTVKFRPGLIEAAPNFMGAPAASQITIQLLDVASLVSWQALPTFLLFGIALLNWRYLPSVARSLLLGVGLTLAFYLLYQSDQGHGWGYRYAYSVLGNIVLIATFGWVLVQRSLGSHKAWAIMIPGLVLFWAVQFPIRVAQVESFTRPFAAASAYIASIPRDFVIIDRGIAWYAQDLVRNDHRLMNSPKVFHANHLTEEQIHMLAQLGSVHRLSADELRRVGMVVSNGS